MSLLGALKVFLVFQPPFKNGEKTQRNRCILLTDFQNLFEVERFARFFRWQWNMTQNLGGTSFADFALKTLHPHSIHISTPIRFQSAGSSWIPQLDAGGRLVIFSWHELFVELPTCFFEGTEIKCSAKKKYPRTKKYMASEDSPK